MGGTVRIINLAELAAVFTIRQFGPKWIVAAAIAAGVVLPEMPLLQYTYLSFAIVLVLIAWLKLRGEDLATFGLIPPRWLVYVGLGVLLAVIQIGVGEIVRHYTTPLIVEWTGADPHRAAKTFASVTGNLPLFLMILPCVWVFAAFGEEFLYRGYLMTRLAQLMGGTSLGWALAIVGQAIAFALAHWYQGLVGMVPIAAGAVISGIAASAWGRNLWPAMVAHGLIDTLGFTMLYLGLPIS